MKLPRVFLGIVLGFVLIVAAIVYDRNHSWSELFHQIGHFLEDGLNWTVAHPILAFLMATYVVVAGVLGRLAGKASSRSGRSLLYGVVLVAALTAWSIPSVRKYFALDPKALWTMAIVAAAVSTISFLHRD
jgi:MFS family permease